VQVENGLVLFVVCIVRRGIDRC